MKILFVSPEIVPFAKTGGLADVAGTLSKALRQLGHEVNLVMPLYKMANRPKFKLKKAIKNIEVKMGENVLNASVYVATLPDTNISVYFIANDNFFNRDELYQINGVDFEDNAERFAFFNLTVLEMLKTINWVPDIIHVHDWQTAYIPIYLKTIYKDDSFFKETKTLYTIHNMGYQGVFPKEKIKAIGLDWDLFTPESLEYWDKINISKGGIIYSDLISTVSPTYSREIQTEEYGCGLDGLLRTRKDDVFGIVNGIDCKLWDPSTDKKIARNYSIIDIKGKKNNKIGLLRKYQLKYNQKTPLIGMVSRLDKQKGFDLLAEAIDSILSGTGTDSACPRVYFILLGTGDSEYHKFFEEVKEKYKEKVGIALGYDAELAQKIYAASDMFLMPSHYEPCGLSQLISLKYGTIPIVRATGGLQDTIIDINQDPVRGNGFVFREYSSKELLDAVNRALEYFNDQRAWEALMTRCMSLDYSWEKSAVKYVELYEKAIKERVTV